MTRVVIAIDGAAGSGKSTLARGLARALDVPYVNTGLMYRALAAEARRSGVPLDDGGRLCELMRDLRFTLAGEPPHELVVEGWPEDALTTRQVEVDVSRVARHVEVRAAMREIQRELGERSGAVMEGRDIGTVVFPDATAKFFLRADPTERSVRRSRERGAPARKVAADLRSRDAQDAQVNPFEPALDAIEIDTTDLTPEQTLDRALASIRGIVR